MSDDPFASKIVSLRKVRQFKQEELAERIGVPVWTLRNWEQAKRRPELAAAYKLAQALEISLDVLGKLAVENPLPSRSKPAQET